MNLRTTLLIPLVVAAAACGRQDAAPYIPTDPNAALGGSATVKVVVLRDTATSRTVAKYVPAGATAANGQTRVSLYRASDPNGSSVKTGLTNANGEVVFTGVPPGDYVVKPVLRSKSTTLVPAAGLPITVGPGWVFTADTLRVKLSTRITGLMSTDYFDQVTQQRIRHDSVAVGIWRETGVGTNQWTLESVVQTDAVGNYDYFMLPGPERIQVRFYSGNITNFKDGTTFQGAPPVPYVKKDEVVTVTNIAPGRDITQNLTFNFPTRITGFVFRDRNNNSFRDSTLVTPAQTGPPPVAATGNKEGLIAGDTIRVQLRNAAGDRVITSVLIATGGTTSQVPTTSATNFGNPVPTYTFASLEPGTYKITMDPLSARFTSNPLEFRSGPTYTVVVPVPSATTGAITITQNFALVTGQ